MIPLYSPADFERAKSKDPLPMRCVWCLETFYKTKKGIQANLNPNHRSNGRFCGNHCSRKSRGENKHIQVFCAQCNLSFIKKENQIM